MNRNLIIIFSGSNDRAVVAFCRYARSRTLSIAIVANGEDDYIYHSDYKNYVVAQRVKNELSIPFVLNIVQGLKKQFSVSECLILPSTEYLNRFLLLHQDELLVEGISFGLCDKQIYELVSDKYSFGELCEENNINVPKKLSHPPYKAPFVIKAKQYSDSSLKINEKPILVMNQNDVENYVNQCKSSNYYVQEYVEGNSFYLLYYIARNKTYTVYSQENLVQQAEGASMILCKSSTIHQEAIADQFAQTLMRENFFGLIMIEVKWHNNQYYMIEANPRLWGPSQLILDAGMNIWDAFAYDNQLIDSIPESNYKEEVFYFWNGGITTIDGLQYYYYTQARLTEELPLLMKTEVYNRTDTINIFNQENNKYA